MDRKVFKKIVLAAVAAVLLYYNVAWAVLRCPHQENHQSQEIAAYEPGSSPRHANLDCTGLRYHTEFLAGPSTNSELLQLTRDVAFHSFFGLPGRTQIEGASRLVLSGKISSAALLVGTPQYIWLSVFRF